MFDAVGRRQSKVGRVAVIKMTKRDKPGRPAKPLLGKASLIRGSCLTHISGTDLVMAIE